MERGCLIGLGGASCLWDDFGRAKALVGDADHEIAACNDAGCEYRGRMAFWATAHPDKFKAVWRHRTDHRGPVFGMVGGIGAGVTHIVGMRQDGGMWRGSSGLYLAQIAVFELGYRRVILCGVPMDARPNAFRDEAGWSDHKTYRAGWRLAFANDEFRAAVRSMSGWTRDNLGAPSPEWLKGCHQ